MPDPVYDLVIGVIDGSTNGVVNMQVSAITRLQRKEEEKRLRGPSKLKVKEVLNLMQKENIGRLQGNDKTLKRVFEYAKLKKVFCKSDSESHSFVMIRGILYRRVQNAGQINNQMIVPEQFRNAVMELAHDSLMGGHLSIQKTTARIQSNFFWPGMSVQIA